MPDVQGKADIRYDDEEALLSSSLVSMWVGPGHDFCQDTSKTANFNEWRFKQYMSHAEALPATHPRVLSVIKP